MLDHEPDGRPHVKALDWNENADDLIFVFADNQTGARCGRFSGAYQRLFRDFASKLALEASAAAGRNVDLKRLNRCLMITRGVLARRLPMLLRCAFTKSGRSAWAAKI